MRILSYYLQRDNSSCSKCMHQIKTPRFISQMIVVSVLTPCWHYSLEKMCWMSPAFWKGFFCSSGYWPLSKMQINWETTTVNYFLIANTSFKCIQMNESPFPSPSSHPDGCFYISMDSANHLCLGTHICIHPLHRMELTLRFVVSQGAAWSCLFVHVWTVNWTKYCLCCSTGHRMFTCILIFHLRP